MSEANYGTYSIEFAHIILAAASETDVLLKQICELIDSNRKVSAINGYRSVIAENHKQFFEHGAVIERYGLSFKPWENWPEEEGPEWWVGYNKVKHHRSTHFEKANLHNALQAVAALFITNLEFMLQQRESYGKKMDVYFPSSMRDVVQALGTQGRLFKLDDPFAYFYE
ncbi:MAG: hypothetical protein H6953_05955 [Chromatiaceae bacterium]|nr:hypothetical protein [Chromatiaceae bacterium]MCP5314928.1 hypothetical protein [Chromatiaceae bacterium]